MVETFSSKESKDSKPQSGETAKKESDFGSFIWEFLRSIPWKMAVFVFLLFIVINSTIFIEYFLEPMGGTYVAGQLTDKGIYTQGMFLAIGYMVLHGLAAMEIV